MQVEGAWTGEAWGHLSWYGGTQAGMKAPGQGGKGGTWTGWEDTDRCGSV